MGSNQIRRLGVVGAGQMGSGIAQVSASWGFETHLIDTQDSALSRSQANISKSLEKLAEKERLKGQDPQQIIDRITFDHSFSDLRSCQLIIEAVPENEDIKKQVLTKLGSLEVKDSIIASNTSSIPITRLATYYPYPEKCIGMHFMNPVPLMTLVEVIPGLQTSETTLEGVMAITKELGKTPIRSQDFPGFTVNRILMPMINEAFFTLYEGIASPEDIDRGMKLGTNQPMGPLQLADFIGLDTCLAIIEILYHGFGDPKYRPCPLLKKMVEAGHLGKKCGQGVYRY